MMSLMKASTVASERVPTPRERSGRPWILFAWGVAVGMLILLTKPTLGPVGYGWGVLTVVGLLSLWLAWIDERTGALPNRIVGALAGFGAIQIVGLVLTGGASTALGAAGAAVLVGVLYSVLGFTGGVGFGDMKFAAALTLAVGAVVGPWAAYLVAIAVMISSFRMIVLALCGQPRRHPHGLSLAVGGISVLLIALIV